MNITDNNRKQIGDYLVIVAFFIAVGLLVYGYTQGLLTLRILIMILALVPLVLVNYFIRENPSSTPKFKKGLAVFSFLFALLFCAVYLRFVPIPANHKPGPDEFGVLFIEFGHQDQSHKDLHERLAQQLNHIEVSDSLPYRAIHSVLLRFDERAAMSVEPATVAGALMAEWNASLACLCSPASANSIRERIIISRELIAKGFHRGAIELTLAPDEFIESMMGNMKALWEFANGKRYSDIDDFSQLPSVVQTLVSAEQFQRGTQLIAELGRMPANGPTNDQIIQEAEAALHKAATIDSLNDRAYDMLGWISWSYRKDRQRAQEFYEKAQRIQPDNYQYTWNLAQHYEMLGKREAAVAVLQDYLTNYEKNLDPSQSSAMKLLLNSYQR
jgi:tetratricopeptide (TPR) repeat protein